MPLSLRALTLPVAAPKREYRNLTPPGTPQADKSSPSAPKSTPPHNMRRESRPPCSTVLPESLPCLKIRSAASAPEDSPAFRPCAASPSRRFPPSPFPGAESLRIRLSAGRLPHSSGQQVRFFCDACRSSLCSTLCRCCFPSFEACAPYPAPVLFPAPRSVPQPGFSPRPAGSDFHGRSLRPAPPGRNASVHAVPKAVGAPLLSPAGMALRSVGHPPDRTKKTPGTAHALKRKSPLERGPFS